MSIGAFAGRGFSEVVMELFRQHGVVLLGISEDHAFVLHPGAIYTIKKVQRSARVPISDVVASSSESLHIHPICAALIACPDTLHPPPPPLPSQCCVRSVCQDVPWYLTNTWKRLSPLGPVTGATAPKEQSDQGALVADDADVAESIVEQAGALLAAASSGKPSAPVVKCTSERSMGGAAGASGE